MTTQDKIMSQAFKIIKELIKFSCAEKYNMIISQY